MPEENLSIPYLVKCLKTDKLSEVVANIDLPALDMNLAVWESIDRSEIKINEETDRIEVLIDDVVPSSNPELKNKILRVIQHYVREGANVTRGRLNSYVKDPVTSIGYGWHDYIMAVQHLIDGGLVVEDVIDVPAKIDKFIDKKGRKKERILRPPHKFAFLGLADREAFNAEWNAKAVEKWIEDFEKTK